MSPVSLDRRSLMTTLLGTSAACAALGISRCGTADAADLPDTPGLPASGNIQLQSIGALGVGHIQSTLGLIGVLADSVSKDMYSQKQIEDLMKGTINGLESPKKMLRRLQDSNVSSEDAEFLDRMISVFNALQREANALIVYSKSRKSDDAQKFEKERKLVLRKLGDLTLQDDMIPTDTAPRAVPNVRGTVPSARVDKPTGLSN